MELTAWLSLAMICLMGAMSPGPSLAVVLKHTVGGGKANGLVAAIAHGVGVGLYAVMTVVGLALVIKSSPLLFNTIRYVGVAFLLYLAFKALTAKSSIAKLGADGVEVSLVQSAWEGFMIAFLNPKLAIFFLALFSQFIHVDADFSLNLILVTTVGVIDTLWYCLIALVLSRPKVLAMLRDNVSVVEKLTGIALLSVAARAVF